MVMASVDNESWRKFLETYKQLPVLWQPGDKNYNSKALRNKAWNNLLEKYRAIESDATIYKLKQRIYNIRTCYCREVRKVAASELPESGSDKVYTPSLWYFDLLEFLKDQVCLPSRKDNDFESEESVTPQLRQLNRHKKLKKHLNGRSPLNHLKPVSAAVTNRRKKFTVCAESVSPSLDKESEDQTRHADTREDFAMHCESWPNCFRQLTEDQSIDTGTNTLVEGWTRSFRDLSHEQTAVPGTNIRDDVAIHAESWACSFRKLTDEQKIFAKRAIDEILVLGQLGKLTYNCTTPSLFASTLSSSTPISAVYFAE